MTNTQRPTCLFYEIESGDSIQSLCLIYGGKEIVSDLGALPFRLPSPNQKNIAVIVHEVRSKILTVSGEKEIEWGFLDQYRTLVPQSDEAVLPQASAVMWLPTVSRQKLSVGRFSSAKHRPTSDLSLFIGTVINGTYRTIGAATLIEAVNIDVARDLLLNSVGSQNAVRVEGRCPVYALSDCF